jgi:hypothetical protein
VLYAFGISAGNEDIFSPVLTIAVEAFGYGYAKVPATQNRNFIMLHED